MKTGNFKTYKGEQGVSICLFPPLNWNGLEFKELAPTKEIFFGIKSGKISKEEYINLYNKNVLGKLDPKKIYEKFKDSVLLCYEAPNEFCHRFLVSQWIKDKLGIDVPEWDSKDIKKQNTKSNSLF